MLPTPPKSTLFPYTTLFRSRRAGTFGAAAAFSFYPGKNLGACGEAGAVTTNGAAIAATIKMLREHGQAKKYYHDLERSEEHTSELQSQSNLVCRLLLEKKNK